MSMESDWKSNIQHFQIALGIDEGSHLLCMESEMKTYIPIFQIALGLDEGSFFFFFFILRRMGKSKALAHHTSTYFHSRRVSI